MEKLNGYSKTKSQVCVECGGEYEARILQIFATEIVLGRGRCRGCCNKKIEEEMAEEEARSKLYIGEQRKNWRESSGIPLKFRNEDFSTFDTKRPGNLAKLYKVCSEYANGFPIEYRRQIETGESYKSLILQSSIAGLGKTHLAASICHHILNRWTGESISNPVAFITESELLGRIEETFSFNQQEKQYRESQEEIIKQLIYRPLLVLDEVGYERRSDLRFVRRILFRLINGRYNNLRPVVLTTNLGQEQLRSYLDGTDRKDLDNAERTFDRLWEMSGGIIYGIEGESYRRKA